MRRHYHKTSTLNLIDLCELGLVPSEKEEWRAAIDRGQQSATFAVLLALLPNIVDLELKGHGFSYKPWLDKAFQFASSSSSILTKLTSAYVAYWDTEGAEDLDVCEELLLIPSFRSLKTNMLACEYGEAEYQSLQTKTGDQRTSHIEEVELSYCGMLHNDIAEFLKPLVNLKKIDMDPYQYDWAYLYG